MKRFILGALAAVSLVAVLAGCASGGRGQGPLATYGFLASANPALPQNVMGIINEQREPKEIFVVVPPGTDLHALVATLSFGAEAGISVVSSGTRVAQQNGVTANDFSVPVTYSIDVPGEKKPWTYIVKVREAETNARLGSLVIPRGAALSPAFNPTVHSYTLTVLYASTSVRVEARGQTSTLKSVTVDGTATPGPAGAAVIDFQNVKERTLVIETLAEDGAARDRYTLTIRRGAPDNNAFLGSLELQNAPLSPSFTPGVLDYQVVVPFETTQLAL
ncbi:MAG: cadherin-like beta sandwich domain-containing protein, partial [Spirochaetia bacterium]